MFRIGKLKNKERRKSMNNEKTERGKQKECKTKKSTPGAKPISYRLKCAKTANGLSHFVMYGDVDKKQSLL